LHNNLVFARGANRQYSKEFAVEGAKIGSTVNIRKPDRAAIRSGQQMQVQAIQDDYVPLTLSNQKGCDFSFSSAELALSVEEFSKRYLTSRMARIAGQIDYDGLTLAKSVYNTVGTTGTTPGTGGGSATGLYQYNSPIVYLNAGMMLDNGACPRDGQRRCLINPAANAQTVQGLSGLYNDSASIGDQFLKGRMGYALDFEFGMDQNVNTITTGTRAVSGEITMSSTAVSGSGTFIVTGGSATIAKGDVFTVTSSGGIPCNSVNPENQVSTGQLQQFVVTDAFTMSGATSITVSPAPILAATGVANGNVTRMPTATDLLTFYGAASTVTPLNIAYHPDAFTLGTADLQLPGGVDLSWREVYDGISLRIVRAYDINNDVFATRIDVLYGWALLRPELCCNIRG